MARSFTHVENDIERDVCDYVRRLGGFAFKMTGITGIPDRLIVLGGQRLWVEFKREDGRTSQAQKDWHRALRLAGDRCIICQGRAEAVELKRELDDMASGTFRLRYEQMKALKGLLALKCSYLYAPMGAGKTIVAGAWLGELAAEDFKSDLQVVIAPPRVIEYVWGGWDIERIPGLQRHLVISLVGLTPAQRREAIAEANRRTDRDVLLLVPNTVVAALDMIEREVQAVVIDEASTLGNPKTQRFKMLRGWFRKAKVKHRVVMSGTPAHRGVKAMWSQYKLVSEKLLQNSYTRFMQQTYNSKLPYPGAKYPVYELRDDALRWLNGQVVDQTVTMIPPPNEVKSVLIEWPVKVERKVLARIKREVMELRKLADPFANAQNHGSAIMMQQLAQGHIYTVDRRVEPVHTAKLDALGEIMEELADSAIVFYSFQHDADAIRKRYSKDYRIGSISNNQDVHAWDMRQVDMLLMHSNSGALGLNLQLGGSAVIWYGIPWSLEVYEQGNARLIRPGQLRTVRIVPIVATGTVDAAIMLALEGRTDIASAWKRYVSGQL